MTKQEWKKRLNFMIQATVEKTGKKPTTAEIRKYYLAQIELGLTPARKGMDTPKAEGSGNSTWREKSAQPTLVKDYLKMGDLIQGMINK